MQVGNPYNSTVWKAYAYKDGRYKRIENESQEITYREQGYKIFYTKDELPVSEDINIPKDTIKVKQEFELEVNPCVLYSVAIEQELKDINEALEFLLINHIKENGIQYEYKDKIYSTKPKPEV